MADIRKIFGGEFTPPTQAAITKTPDEQFIDAILAAGMNPPNGIIFDGQIHRFICDDNKDRKRNGWYIAYDGRIKAGAFGDWRTDFKQTWREDLGRPLDMAEGIDFQRQMREAKEKAELERKAKQEEAAETAEQIWQRSTPAPEDHPYLINKGIQPHGIRLDGMRLVIPLRNHQGDITSVQHIDISGAKRFLKGGAVAGARFTFHGSKDSIYLAEGFATGASIYEATGCQTVVAFSANQLAPVAESIRAQHPTARLVVVADNDEAGIKSANEAASASGATIIRTPIEGMDANDYALAGNDLATLLQPQTKPQGLLIDADELCESIHSIRWLVKGVLQAEAFMMIHGASGGGKTFTVLDLCLHMAAGLKSWFGHKVTQGKVLYLAGEGQHGIKNRIMAWKQHHKVKSLDKNMMVFPVAVDLDVDGVEQIVAELESSGFKPDLVVVDTLNRFMAGDENRSNETRAMINNCAKIQSLYACSMLVVHHTGNSEDTQHRARGSSAWKGALDIEISIAPASESEPIKIKQMKSKDSELIAPIFAELQSVYLDGQFDEDGEH